MFEFDETIEQGAIIFVIGVGAFGIRTVSQMVGKIHKVKCIGVSPDGSVELTSLPCVSIAKKSGHNYDYTPLLNTLGAPDLVFVVADPDDTVLLRSLCNTLRESGTLSLLVITESTRHLGDVADLPKYEEDSTVPLNGVIIVSKSSIEPPYPAYWNPDLSSNLFQFAIRQFTDPITTKCLPPVDFADIKSFISRGGPIFFGIGIACGEDRSIMAAEKAAVALKNQGIALEKTTKATAAIIYGSNDVSMNDYNLINNFFHGRINDECNKAMICVVRDNWFGDSLLVNIITVQDPSENIHIPYWVRIIDECSVKSSM